MNQAFSCRADLSLANIQEKMSHVCLGIKCLFLDFVDPITHQAMETN